jgi:tetratricopeptide (TPR) repeat protein
MAQVRVGSAAVGGMAVLLAASALWAQPRGTSGGAPDSGSNAPAFGGARSTRSPGSTGDGQTNSDNSSARSPADPFSAVSLSGKVVLEDGTPPPDPVGIERVCNGVVRPEGYTDSKGRFSIQLGQNSLAFADASVGSNNVSRGSGSSSGAAPGSNGVGATSGRDLSDCEFRAALPGYRSDEVSLAAYRAMGPQNVGTLILHRYAHGEGDTVSFTSLAAPKEAIKALQRGRDAARKEKWDEASKQFEKAVEIDPKYASAWFELGRTRESLQDESGAWDAYQRAIASDERFIPPYVQVAAIELKRLDWAAAIETTDHIVRLDPVNFPGAYIYRSIAEFSLRKLEAAEKSVRQALDLDTAHRLPVADHVLGVILAQRGDFSGAAAHLRTYLRLAPNASDVDLAKDQLTQIERLSRSTSTLPGTP